MSGRRFRCDSTRIPGTKEEQTKQSIWGSDGQTARDSRRLFQTLETKSTESYTDKLILML